MLQTDRKSEALPQPVLYSHDSGLFKRAALIVAHPDDEVLWAGGYVLTHPEYRWFILTLTRRSDADRAPRFFNALEHLHAEGGMGDLNDGPDQVPLQETAIHQAILDLLPVRDFDLILTHGTRGEYTRHRRHEETSASVSALWKSGHIKAPQLLMFAYDDEGGRRLPRDAADAHLREVLSEEIWQTKYRIITEIYGFSPNSWEARTTPLVEAFWSFEDSGE